MASSSWHRRVQSLWLRCSRNKMTGRTYFCGCGSSSGGRLLLAAPRPTLILHHHHRSPFSVSFSGKGYHELSSISDSAFSHSASLGNVVMSSTGKSEAEPMESQRQHHICSFNWKNEAVNLNLSRRVMLIDGTSIIYRAYFKLLAKLHHGHLSNADGNGDWVLTIFTALSLIIDVLEFIPSHVAVVFDHNDAGWNVAMEQEMRAL